MTWRRKALLTTIVLGAGVIGLRPFLSYAIGNRIAYDWRVKASVENTELSIVDKAVFLKNLQISDSNNSIRIQEVALRLDAYAALFRNGVVESLVGKGLTWDVSSTQNAERASSKLVQQTASPLISANEDPRIEQIKALLERSRIQLAAIERTANNNTANIDRRIGELQTKIREADTPDTPLNPLRQSNVVEELRSELLLLQQSLAEDRLQTKDSEKVIEEVTRDAESLLKQIAQDAASVEEITVSASQRIADETLAIYESQLLPFAEASQFVFERISGIGAIQETAETPSASVTSGQDLVLDDLEPRVTRIKRGKIVGKCSINGAIRPIKITVSGADVFSNKLYQPALGIVWESATQPASITEHQRISSVESSITIDRTTNMLMPSLILNVQATTASGLISLTRTIQRDQTLDRWSIPIVECTQAKSAVELGVAVDANSSGAQNECLVVSSMISPQRTDKAYQKEPRSISILERWVAGALAEVRKKQQQSNLDTARSVIQSSLEQLKRRQSALASAQLAKQQGWASQLQQVDHEVLELREIIRRTTRKNSSVMR